MNDGRRIVVYFIEQTVLLFNLLSFHTGIKKWNSIFFALQACIDVTRIGYLCNDLLQHKLQLEL